MSIDSGASVGRLSIDVAAIRANYRTIARQTAPAIVSAVIKADAYGLGARRVAPAQAREGCRHFFVAHLGEALSLIDVLPADARLFVLNGLAPGSEAACAAAGVTPVLNSIDQLRRWTFVASERGSPLPTALQLDSGMARMGLSAVEVEALAGDAGVFDLIDLRLVMSHLASGDEPGNPLNTDQLARFQAMASRLPPAPRSLANSGGCFLDPAFHMDMVRPGVALYGGAPHRNSPGLAPVVALDAGVVQVREVPAGTGVGYAHAYRSVGAMRPSASAMPTAGRASSAGATSPPSSTAFACPCWAAFPWTASSSTSAPCRPGRSRPAIGSN